MWNTLFRVLDGTNLDDGQVIIAVLARLCESERRVGGFNPGRVRARVLDFNGGVNWYRVWPPQFAVRKKRRGSSDDDSEGYNSEVPDKEDNFYLESLTLYRRFYYEYYHLHYHYCVVPIIFIIVEREGKREERYHKTEMKKRMER